MKNIESLSTRIRKSKEELNKKTRIFSTIEREFFMNALKVDSFAICLHHKEASPIGYHIIGFSG